MVSEPAGVRILPMGEHAILAEVDSLDEAIALHARLESARPAGIVDLVPAARTVLARVDPARMSLSAARSWVERTTTDAASSPAAEPRVVELEVVYDGADLVETAALLGVSADELVRRHSSADWTVAFTGFAPGFGYLVSPDWTFDVPRLATPRTRVPRGSVGLAAGFTGAYPRDTPGGWRLIATTDAALFDPDAASPALLAPGTRVRFTPGRRTGPRQCSGGSRQRADPAVSRSGSSLAVGSRGAPGGGAGTAGHPSGSRPAGRCIARGGPVGRPRPRLGADGEPARRQHRGCGGHRGDDGRLRAVADRDLWFAVTGAWGPILLDGHEVDPYEAHEWHAGVELQLAGTCTEPAPTSRCEAGSMPRRCSDRARRTCSPGSVHRACGQGTS